MPLSQNVISDNKKPSSVAAPVAVVSAQKSGIFSPAPFLKPLFCPDCRPGVGGVALDLINGHLTELSLSLSSPSFVPVKRGLPPEREPKGWFCRPGHNPHKPFHYVAKVQAFESGGYEVTLLRSDLNRIAGCMDAPRLSGRRVQGEQDGNNIVSSINRSKRRMRHLVKSMGCDRMLNAYLD